MAKQTLNYASKPLGVTSNHSNLISNQSHLTSAAVFNGLPNLTSHAVVQSGRPVLAKKVVASGNSDLTINTVTNTSTELKSNAVANSFGPDFPKEEVADRTSGISTFRNRSSTYPFAQSTKPVLAKKVVASGNLDLTINTVTNTSTELTSNDVANSSGPYLPKKVVANRTSDVTSNAFANSSSNFTGDAVANISKPDLAKELAVSSNPDLTSNAVATDLRKEVVASSSSDLTNGSRNASSYSDLERNVIIIGLTGVGKTTIVNKTLQCKPKTTESIIDVRTKEIEISGVPYTVNVVDVDLDLTYTIIPFRERIYRLRRSLQSSDITSINLVVFVIAADRLPPNEKTVLTRAISKFNWLQLSPISALFITRCEQMNDQKREDIVKQFCEDGYTSDIARLMSKGIITTGFVSIVDQDKDNVRGVEAETQKDVEKIYELIAGAKDKVTTNHLFVQNFWENFLANIANYNCMQQAYSHN